VLDRKFLEITTVAQRITITMPITLQTDDNSHSQRLAFWAMLTGTSLLWSLYVGAVVFWHPAPAETSGTLLRAVMRIGVVLLPAILYAHYYEEWPRQDFLLLKTNWRRGITIGILTSLVIFGSLALANRASLTLATDRQGSLATWTNFFIGSPFAEEVMYRGVVLQVFARRFGTIRATVFSSIWFALLHLPWWLYAQPAAAIPSAMLTIFVYGLVFCCLFSWSRSIWGAVIPHVCNNIYSTLFSV